MKNTVTETMFIEDFKNIRPDNFSYEGLRALFSWLEEYEEDTGEELEMDVIALCCDFDEWDSMEDFNEYYGLDCEDIADVIEHTAYINIDGESFITQAF